MAVNSPIRRNPKKASVAAASNIHLSWLWSDLMACDELSSLASMPGVIGCLQQLLGGLARFERRISLNSSLRIWLPLTTLRRPSEWCKNDTAARYTLMVGRVTVDQRCVANAATRRLLAGTGWTWKLLQKAR